MKLIFGLGNPDRQYTNTRHNIGQTIIKKLASNFTHSSKLKSYQSPTSDSIYAYSTEYMNNSGISIALIARFYKIPPNQICLIHDDLDLPVGEWKLQFDRGPAGHNGVQSVIDHLGTQAFWRYRIGIGHPIDLVPVESYVLQPFTPEEKGIIDQTIDKIVEDLKKGH